MTEAVTLAEWGKYIGHQVEFRKPGYVDSPWEKGRFIRVEEGTSPILDLLIVQSETNEIIKILRTRANEYLVLLSQVPSV